MDSRLMLSGLVNNVRQLGHQILQEQLQHSQSRASSALLPQLGLGAGSTCCTANSGVHRNLWWTGGQVYNDVWAGSPELPATYSSCYATHLTGQVLVRNNSGLQFYTSDTPAAYYSKFRFNNIFMAHRSLQLDMLHGFSHASYSCIYGRACLKMQ